MVLLLIIIAYIHLSTAFNYSFVLRGKHWHVQNEDNYTYYNYCKTISLSKCYNMQLISVYNVNRTIVPIDVYILC